ncbi:hypothetical protein Ciccas_003688 [Cichlidogyrus casuarinus]|uniref:Dynein regulatory complex protein 9 n=1 Tax=Cichlidogyrus casuarinus TaxID=1844966 RepID=A0ABD2QEF9_9PLAT
MTLYGGEAVSISTALMESAMQLKILENIFSNTSKEFKQNHESSQRSVEDLITRHQEYQLYFEKIIEFNTISDEKIDSDPSQRVQVTKHILESSKDLIEKRMREQYIARVSKACSDLHNILKEASMEILEKGTFQSLEQAVNQRQIAQETVENAHKTEEELRKHIKVLKKKIDSANKAHELSVKERKEVIAHMKDQLQELKAKTLMERKYRESVCEVQLAKVKSECEEREKALTTQIKDLNDKADEERVATFETTSWLQSRMAELVSIENHWNLRSTTDMADMQHQLDVLKKSREKDLQALADLTEKYEQEKQVVVEERIREAEEKRQKEIDERNLECTRIIQDWWRTVMVRKQLGPYGKKKKGAKKKGGKKKK